VGADGKIEDAKFKTFGCGSAIASRCVGLLPAGPLGRAATMTRRAQRCSSSLGAVRHRLCRCWNIELLRSNLSVLRSHPISRALLVLRSSVATEWILGKSIDECLSIKNTDIASHLKLPPVKLHCSMLAEDAIKAAVKDFQKKRVGEGEEGAAAAAKEGLKLATA
jgi:hypothetical protein